MERGRQIEQEREKKRPEMDRPEMDKQKENQEKLRLDRSRSSTTVFPPSRCVGVGVAAPRARSYFLASGGRITPTEIWDLAAKLLFTGMLFFRWFYLNAAID